VANPTLENIAAQEKTYPNRAKDFGEYESKLAAAAKRYIDNNAGGDSVLKIDESNGSNNVITPDDTVSTIGSDDFLVGAEVSPVGDPLDYDGANRDRMFFDKSKGAFRVGRAIGTQWDDASRGVVSTAWGNNTTASSSVSTAWGNSTTASVGQNNTAWGFGTTASGIFAATAWGSGSVASGDTATAWGLNTTASIGGSNTAWGIATTASGTFAATAWGNGSVASGDTSTAWGFQTDATNLFATSWGNNSLASGDTSTAWGLNTIASGLLATSLGNQNISAGNNSVTLGSGFEMQAGGAGSVGIGLGNGGFNPASTFVMNQSNSMSIMGGNVGIGTVTPDRALHAVGIIKLENMAVHADDTAAGVAGLVSGDVYRTATGEIRVKL